MREVRTGVWHVSSYAIDDGARQVLFDPLALSVEIVLLTHGARADRPSLERALATPSNWDTAR